MGRRILAAIAVLGLGGAGAALVLGHGAPAAEKPAEGFSSGRLEVAIDEVRRRAEAGDAAAEYLYGRRYEEGDGVLQDHALAHMWYNLAATHGSAEAQAARARLVSSMSPEQLARAEDMARRRLGAATPVKASPSPNGKAPEGKAPEGKAPEGKAGQGAAVDVADVQHRLAELGYPVGTVDGKLGPRTRAALRAYQRQAGLPQTGDADPAVMAALSGSHGSAPGTGGAPPGAVSGDENPVDAGRLAEVVREVQQRLLRRGYWRGPETGAESPDLRRAIAAYQSDAGLPPTGQVSERLLDHLRYARPEVTPQQARAR